MDDHCEPSAALLATGQPDAGSSSSGAGGSLAGITERVALAVRVARAAGFVHLYDFVHEHVRLGNTALAKGDDDGVRAALGGVRAMLDVLGIDPLDPAWSTESSGGTPGEELREIIDSLVALALEQRAQARTRKDWSAADAVRDQLNAAGVNVEDTPHGPRLTIGTRD